MRSKEFINESKFKVSKTGPGEFVFPGGTISKDKRKRNSWWIKYDNQDAAQHIYSLQDAKAAARIQMGFDRQKNLEESESYQAPEIKVGDKIKVGKFKNKKAEIKSITKDKKNHPVLQTDKGEYKLYRVNLDQLEDEGDQTVKSTEFIKETKKQDDIKWIVKLHNGKTKIVWAKNQAEAKQKLGTSILIQKGFTIKKAPVDEGE